MDGLADGLCVASSICEAKPIQAMNWKDGAGLVP
jgi:hypothetical protein